MAKKSEKKEDKDQSLVYKSNDIGKNLRVKINQHKSISRLSKKALTGIELNMFLQSVTEEIQSVLNVDIVKVLEQVNDKEFRIKAAVGLKNRYKIGHKIEVSRKTHAGYTFLRNEPIIVENLETEKRFKGSSLLKDHGIVSGISVVITHEEKPFGVLTAHSVKTRIFSKDDIDFFASIANLISLVIARKKVESFLNLYQERFYYAQKAGNIGIFDWNMITGDLWWSDEHYELIGHKLGPNDSIQEELTKRIFKEDLVQIRKKMNDAKKSKKDIIFEYRVKSKDGTTKFLKSRGKLYFDKKGKAVRALGVTYDITDRKNMEESLSFLSESSRILSSSLEYNKTLQSVARIAVPKIADWCSVDFVTPDGKVELVAVAHVDPKKVEWAIKYREQNPPNMEQETGLPKVIRTGKPEFYPYVDPKLLVNLKPKEKKVLEEIGGITAVIIVPLKNKKKVTGVLTLVSSESKRKFTELDLNIAEQIADRASLAIENTRLYQSVNEERKRLNHLLYNVPGIVWERWFENSQDRPPDFVSNYIEKMIGYKTDVIDKPGFWDRVIHPKDRQKVDEIYNGMIETGKGGVIRARWITKKGRIIWAESHIFMVKDDSGKVIGARGVTMDITDRVEIEKRKDEFISMASHELKTPLTSMKVFSHLLEKKLSQDDKVNPYLSRMDEQIDKLTGLVNDLLDISKIQAGKLEIRKQQIVLKDFIEDSISEMKLITNEQIIATEVDDVTISADRDRLSQVLMNLISNAIKYSPPNTPIEIKAKLESEVVVFSVKDEGFGISKEHQGKIFQRFYRVYDNIDRTYPGLGMGLYISDQIVRRHRGTMWLESEKGKGSTFYFSVPAEASN